MKTLVIFILLVFSNSFSQSKKEQIILLNSNIDSLNIILNKNKNEYLKNIDSLIRENSKLNLELKNLQIIKKNELKSKTDSIILVKVDNENLKNKINNKSRLIELFINSLTLENREFDLYKDSKLSAQLFFLNLLFVREKIKVYLPTTPYGVLLGNRLLNSNLKDDNKKIFDNEFNYYIKDYLDNFSNANIVESGFYLNLMESLKVNSIYEGFLQQINTVKPLFEEEKAGVNYYMVNDPVVIKKRIVLPKTNVYNIKIKF